MKTGAGDRHRLAAELIQTKQRVADLEKQLVDRDEDLAGLKGRLTELDASKQRASELERQLGNSNQELAGMRGALEQQRTTLAQAKEDLAKLLQVEVSKGNVTMKQLEGGMTSDKIEALGHADSRPVASNSSGDGRQKNRRVEIVVRQ